LREKQTTTSQLISWLFGQNDIKTNNFCVLAMYAIIQVLNTGIFTSSFPPHRVNTGGGDEGPYRKFIPAGNTAVKGD